MNHPRINRTIATQLSASKDIGISRHLPGYIQCRLDLSPFTAGLPPVRKIRNGFVLPVRLSHVNGISLPS